MSQKSLLTFDENSSICKWDITTVGIPKETLDGENRVACSPDSLTLLTKAGYRVLIETGAGDNAGFSDIQYMEVGGDLVEIVYVERVYEADVILKVNMCTDDEVDRLSP